MIVEGVFLQDDRVRVVVVIVLYGLTAEDSSAFRSLRDAFRAGSGLSAKAVCLVYDNSHTRSVIAEEEQSTLSYSYKHDSTNPGLARHYQEALQYAEANGIPWLLLLDQDTLVTQTYLDEVFQMMDTVSENSRVVALVPRLMQDGVPLSPHPPMWHRSGPMSYSPGLKSEKLRVFNSGAVIRVAALLRQGGFPQDFPLDYLDHATFHGLQKDGGRIVLLASGLEHHLSSKHHDFLEEFASSRRTRATAGAESLYYYRFGTVREKVRHILRRGKMVLGLLTDGKVRVALRLAVITMRPPNGFG